MNRYPGILAIAVSALAVSLFAGAQTNKASSDWPAYGGEFGDHYSPLRQINRANVNRLVQAWIFDTHEEGGLETSPIIIGKTLYAYTATQKVIALNAATGALLWKFDSGIIGTQPVRGLSYWSDGHESRILAGVMHFLYALDARTGKPIESFGEGGRIDLRKDLRGDYELQSIDLTSPGVVYKDLIIVGGRNPETHPSPPGDIRAFDVRNGKLRWRFHTIPHPGEYGYETWPKDAWKQAGAANNWAGMALDARRGIVFVPTGSPVFDFYGADRVGDNLFADSLLALDANTGKRLWHFQGVHHDLWDRDFPSPPALMTIMHNGRRVDAVAQTTKQGYLFVLDRVTGKPIFPIEERSFPRSEVPGEVTSPTQPVPTFPEPFTRQILTADMLTDRTPEAHAAASKDFATFRSGGQFIPTGLNKETVVFPCFLGGAEWGGPAIDRQRGVIFVNANEAACVIALTENKPARSTGERTYQNQCSICHGKDRAGSPPTYPSLVDVDKKLSKLQIESVVTEGKGRMPGFPNLTGGHLASLAAFLTNTEQPTAAPAAENTSSGADIYKEQCAACHGADRQGKPPAFPSLANLQARLSAAQAANTIRHGEGRMPAFAGLNDGEVQRLLAYLEISSPASDPDHDAIYSSTADGAPMPYQVTGSLDFLDSEGYPAIKPPWGTLNAIDLNTGKYLWKIPLGEYPELAAKGLKNTGSENYGGPVVTAGGVLFIGATVYDKKFRALDVSTGKLLWETMLPYAAVATPATYMIDGKQYVVVAAGGGKDPKSPSGSTYVAFALK